MLKHPATTYLILTGMFVTLLSPGTASAGQMIPEADLILFPRMETYVEGDVVQYRFSVTPEEGFTYEATICMPSGVCYDLTGPDGLGDEGTVVMEAGPEVGQLIVTKYNDIGEGVAQDRTDFAVVHAQEPPRDKHRSKIKFKLKKHLVAAGVVRATDGARECMTQRRVIVQRQVGGSWRGVRSDRTRATGKYRIRLPDTTGTYRAIVKKKATIRDICSGDESDARRHLPQSSGGGGGGGHRHTRLLLPSA